MRQDRSGRADERQITATLPIGAVGAALSVTPTVPNLHGVLSLMPRRRPLNAPTLAGRKQRGWVDMDGGAPPLSDPIGVPGIPARQGVPGAFLPRTDSSFVMSLNASQRRDQRRRLVVSWKRSADAPQAAESPRSPRLMAAYEPQAHPEKQPGPAVLLPTGIGGLALAVVAILVPVGAAILAATSEHLFGRSLFVGGGRFARTLAAAGAVLDARGAASLQVWLSQMMLVGAAGVALIVRLMRRHRRDDFKGRFRAWGWMAALFLLAACAGVVPVGRLTAAILSDATGIALGPDGVGWWIGLATVAFAAVSLWAVLPLHERMATAIWLTLALGAWCGAAVATWLAAGREQVAIAGMAAWSLGAAFALIAMLAAARSVIREVRGQCDRPAVKPKAEKAEKPKAVARGPQPEEEEDAAAYEPAEASGDEHDTVYVDGSEHETRHLSKAERKRLRKLARMNGAAA